IFPSSYKNPTPGSNQSRNYRERATTHRCGAEDHTTQHQVKRRLSVLRILFKTSILVVCIHRTWDVCRYEYSRQTTAFVKMPPTPEGWTACQMVNVSVLYSSTAPQLAQTMEGPTQPTYADLRTY
ncbi:unnamed protein product, partial [Allacma fusca]